MLLTEISWEVEDSVLRGLVPYQPWRYVGISLESPCFLVKWSQHHHGEQPLLKNFLVAKPEDVLQMIGLLGVSDCRVYWLHIPRDDEECSRLEPVHAIKSYCLNGVTWFNHIDADGVAHPSSLSWQPAPEADTTMTTEWVCEGALEGSTVLEQKS